MSHVCGQLHDLDLSNGSGPHLALALQLITMTVCILVAEDALVNVSEVMPDPHESAGTASFTSVDHRLELIAGH